MIIYLMVFLSKMATNYRIATNLREFAIAVSYFQEISSGEDFSVSECSNLSKADVEHQN